MNYMFKNFVLLSLVLSVNLWHSSEALFENVGKCDEGVLNVLNSAWGSGDPPSNILKQWKRNQPWSILHASKDLFPTESKSVVMSDTYVKVNKETRDPINEAINWSEDLGVLKDKNLRWYVLNIDTDIFAFCICSTEDYLQEYFDYKNHAFDYLNIECFNYRDWFMAVLGTSNNLKGGIALSMGRPGGIPDETMQAAKDTKEMMTSYGIGLEVELDLSSD